MTLYRLLLLLLVAAVVGTLAVYGLRGDTGYVLIQRGDLAIETTLVNAVFLLLAALALLYVAVWLLRWPLRLWQAGARRGARRRFLDGMIALVAGRPSRAGQQLLKATRLPSLKLPALIAAHAAAHARGDRAEEVRLLDLLTEAAETHDLATELRARNELLDGRAGAAIEMLVPLAQASRLSPMGARWADRSATPGASVHARRWPTCRAFARAGNCRRTSWRASSAAFWSQRSSRPAMRSTCMRCGQT